MKCRSISPKTPFVMCQLARWHLGHHRHDVRAWRSETVIRRLYWKRQDRIRAGLLVLFASALLVTGITLPATAHGTCVINTSNVFLNQSTQRITGNISRSCQNVHYEMYITALFQERINGTWWNVCSPGYNCSGITATAFNTTFIQWNQGEPYNVPCQSLQSTAWRIHRIDAGNYARSGSSPGHVLGSANGPISSLACRV